MKNFATKYIEKKVEAEAGKINLSDEYGPFWFVVGEVLGNWVFGFIGAAADAITLWGFLYLLTKAFWPSVFGGIIVAASIQIVLGKSVVRATKTAHRGDIKSSKSKQYKGFRRQLTITALIALSMLTASLFISKVSDSPVKARTEMLRDRDKINLENIRAPFLARIEQEKEIYSRDSASVWQAITRLQNDKVHDSAGKLVTRYAHLSTINKLTNTDLVEIREHRDNAISEIKAEMKDAVYYADVENQDTDAKYDRADHMAETYVIGGNILFQILRTILLLGMTVFLVDAAVKDETKKEKKEEHAPPHVAPARSETVGEFETVRAIEMLRAETERLRAETEDLKRKPETVETETETVTGPKSVSVSESSVSKIDTETVKAAVKEAVREERPETVRRVSETVETELKRKPETVRVETVKYAPPKRKKVETVEAVEIERKCLQCGGSMKGKKSTAKFCGPDCKNEFHNSKR